jgi:hypothetical protein
MKNKRTIKDVEKDIEKARESISKLYEEKKELEHDELNLDFEGKYIEFENHVMYVEDVMRDNFRFQNFDFCYLFRGLGFYSLITGYSDATDIEWSYWHELYIYGNTKKEFENKIKKIKVITKEEYIKKFDEMTLRMIEYNKSAIDFYENKDKNC